MTLLAAMSLHAQVLTWSVKPGTYTKIEPCWGSMYYAYSGNKVGIISGDGRVIVEPSATRITGFYGGLALVLKSSGGQERIMGILSTEGEYAEVDGNYTTFSDQEFFSEGYLTVTTPQGTTAGFMDANGRLVKDYQVAFVSPFSEGYAVVGEGDGNFSIIDKKFNEQQISITSMSPLWNGANVYKGTAIVWDGNGTLFEFTPRQGASCTIVKDKAIKKVLKDCDFNPDYDYLGGIKALTGRPEEVPYDQPEYAAVTLQASNGGGKYGYVKDSKVILPYQFEQADDFHGSYAIVRSNGKYGLLVLHNTDDTFGASANSDITYKKGAGKDLQHKFGITLPDYWNENEVRVKVKDADGTAVELNNSGSTYVFKADGGKDKETRKYSVEIGGDGMLLWQGEIAYNYTMETEGVIGIKNKPLTVSLKAANTQADKDNRCYVNATIHNPNPQPITATVSMTGSNLLEAVSKTLTIPAYGSKDVSTYFKLAKTVHKGFVTVSTSAGGSAKLENLQLIPF